MSCVSAWREWGRRPGTNRPAQGCDRSCRRPARHQPGNVAHLARQAEIDPGQRPGTSTAAGDGSPGRGRRTPGCGGGTKSAETQRAIELQERLKEPTGRAESSGGRARLELSAEEKIVALEIDPRAAPMASAEITETIMRPSGKAFQGLERLSRELVEDPALHPRGRHGYRAGPESHRMPTPAYAEGAPASP